MVQGLTRSQADEAAVGWLVLFTETFEACCDDSLNIGR
jgi:hypothetical protein